MMNTHITHCCARHGCKYDNDNCPVKKGKVTQAYPCDICDWELRHDGGGLLELAYLMNEMYDKGFAAGNDKGFESGLAACLWTHQ